MRQRKNKPTRKNRKTFVSRIALFLTLLMMLSTGTTFAQTFQVKGNSMYPTIKDGDILDVDEKEPDYKDGDVVIAKLKDGKHVVKRLVGDMLVGDNKGASIDIPMSDVDSILGKASQNDEDLTEDEKKEFEKVFALGVKQLEVGYTSALVTLSGDVYAWGANASGQLGNGSNSEIDANKVPKRISSLSNIRSITVGQASMGAITTNGSLFTWGSNGYGQLCHNDYIGKPSPVRVASLSTVKQFEINEQNSVILTDAGSIYTCGSATYGLIGDGRATTGATAPSPVKVSITGVDKISLGTHALALKAGNVFAWGYNLYGQLGDGSTTINRAPVQVAGLPSGITDIAAGEYHSGAVTPEGTVYTWGLNSDGQLMNGTTTNSLVPKLSKAINIKSILFGGNTSLAITKDDNLYIAGSTSYGLLGDGFEIASVTSLTKIVGMTGLKSASIGKGNKNVIGVISASGSPFAWGRNPNGGVGNGGAGGTVPYPSLITGYSTIDDLSRTISGVIYLPKSAPIPEGFSASSDSEITKVSAEFQTVLYVFRYDIPTTIGNLNIQ